MKRLRGAGGSNEKRLVLLLSVLLSACVTDDKSESYLDLDEGFIKIEYRGKCGTMQPNGTQQAYVINTYSQDLYVKLRLTRRPIPYSQPTFHQFRVPANQPQGHYIGCRQDGPSDDLTSWELICADPDPNLEALPRCRRDA
ncbi:MAG: hypothetical protein H0W74_06665 [Sphingosinicella sp.]|nr:hypothetical protein [Sphingosinicella sp.]